MQPFQGVLLDVDGTLVDSNDAHADAWVHAFREHGFDISFDAVRDRIGKGGDKMVIELVALDEEDPTAKAIREARSKRFLEELAPKLRGFRQARKLIQRMKDDGLAVAVASSAESKELDTLLAIAEVDDLIDDQTSSDDAENSKPDPDIVIAALQGIDLTAPQVVMLGDTPYDVEAATKAGVAVIAVRSGGWADEDLRGAIAVYDDVADLLAHYDDSPLGTAARDTPSEA
nr:HAD family hydrolase [Paludisphaera mucosa]